MQIKNNLLIFLLFVVVSSCAKEIYNNEDATRAVRESQKVGLTVIVRDISGHLTDLSGFKVSTLQCGEEIESMTSSNGVADLMIVKGDAALTVEKDGYLSAIAVVSTNASEKERNNTVVIIPVFPQGSVIDDIDMNELTGGKYQPGALTYLHDD